MWNERKNRIADLEARLEVALRSRSRTDDDSVTAELRAHLRKTRTDLRTTETQLGESREQVAQLIKRLGEYADNAVANDQKAERYRLAWKSARFRARPGEPVHDELWRLLDWCFWGAGMGDVLREPLADTMTAAISDGQRADALRIMTWWTEDRGRKPIGRWQYEEDKRRIKRLALACARYRAELAEQHAVLDRQTEQLFDAISYPDGQRNLLAITHPAPARPGPAVTAGEVAAP